MDYLPVLLSILLTVACTVLVSVAVLHREREKRLKAEQEARKLSVQLKALEQRRIVLENKIHALNRKARIREEVLAALRKENAFLIRNSFRYLGNLYYVYLITGASGAVTNRLKEIWNKACGPPDKLNRLAGFLDSHSENLVRELRASVSRLGDDEITLFCCFVLGFDAPLIAELTKVSVNTIYSRKNRIAGKIMKLGPARARRFLDLLE